MVTEILLGGRIALVDRQGDCVALQDFDGALIVPTGRQTDCAQAVDDEIAAEIEALRASISGPDSIEVGQPALFQLTFIADDPRVEILVPHTISIFGSDTLNFTVTPTETGPLTISATVTDQATGQSITVEKTVQVVEGTTSAPFNTGNLIVNGDAESGGAGSELADTLAPPSWDTTGDLRQMSYANDQDFPVAGDPGPPNRGAAFFAGGDNDSLSTATQLIPLADDLAADINAGGVQYDLAGWFGGFAGQDDSAVLTVAFLNADGGVLGTAQIGGFNAAARGGVTALLQDTATGSVPAGATAIRVSLQMNRDSGTANDGYADQLELILLRD